MRKGNGENFKSIVRDLSAQFVVGHVQTQFSQVDFDSDFPKRSNTDIPRSVGADDCFPGFFGKLRIAIDEPKKCMCIPVNTPLQIIL